MKRFCRDLRQPERDSDGGGFGPIAHLQLAFCRFDMLLSRGLGDAGHGGRSGPFAPGSVKELYGSMFEKLAGSAPWFKTWCYISGGTLLAIAGFYLFASIMLLQLKKYGVILFYIAIAASCAYSFINAAVFFSAGSMIGIMLVFVSIAAGIVNGVLLLTVIFSDKKAFMM